MALNGFLSLVLLKLCTRAFYDIRPSEYAAGGRNGFLTVPYRCQ